MKIEETCLTTEEFRVLKAADEKMKHGKPKKTGWYWFYYRVGDTKHRSWAPARVVFVAGSAEYLRWGLGNKNKNWKPLGETMDNQWGEEIGGPLWKEQI